MKNRVKRIEGRKYDLVKAKMVGTTCYEGEGANGTTLFRKGTGEYFIADYNDPYFYYDEYDDYIKNYYANRGDYELESVTPLSVFEAVKWGKKYLEDCDFEKEFGAPKESFVSLAEGKTEHKRYVSREDNQYVQRDTLTTRISLNALEDKSKFLLDYWWVEEFKRAYIVGNGDIVLEYETEHYVPWDHVLEMLRDPDTIDLTKEED